MENIKLDKDWLLLLKDLNELGVSKGQFKEFIETKKRQKEDQKENRRTSQ